MQFIEDFWCITFRFSYLTVVLGLHLKRLHNLSFCYSWWLEALFFNLKLVRVSLFAFYFLKFCSCKLSGVCGFEFSKPLSDCLLAYMHCFDNLRWRPSKAMNLCTNKYRSSTEAVGSPSSCHPRPIHWLDKPNRSVFYLLELISKLKFAAEPVNEKTGVDDRNINVFHKDLTGEDLEHFCDFEHVHLDRVWEIN